MPVFHPFVLAMMPIVSSASVRRVLVPGLAAWGLAQGAIAAPTVEAALDHPVVRLSPFTYHFAHYSDHKPVVAMGIDVPTDPTGNFIGASFFSNSFGQPSAYAYVGRKYLRPFGWSGIYWHVTAGIMYGYVEPYEHKVPFNSHGYAPAIVPTAGWQINRRSALEVSMLGFAGVMFSYVKTLD